jgi:hypothetical protein
MKFTRSHRDAEKNSKAQETMLPIIGSSAYSRHRRADGERAFNAACVSLPVFDGDDEFAGGVWFVAIIRTQHTSHALPL